MNTRRRIQIGFIAFWMIFLCSSVVLKFTASVLGWPRFKPFPAYEKREKARFPNLRELNFKEYGAKIEDYYNDNFAFRTTVIGAYRDFHYYVLKAYFSREVPGKGDWVFRHGGDWAEIDDYLGAIVLTDEELSDLRMLFEGRLEWARAHGSDYIQLITPVKAQIHPEKLPYLVRVNKGIGVSEQIKNAFKGLKILDNIVFFDDIVKEAVAEGREVFYHEDHHLNAYGTYLLYYRLNECLNKKYGDIEKMKFFEEPPESVRRKEEAGCYVENNRLVVSRPGDRELEDSYVVHTRGSLRYPLRGFATTRDDDGLNLFMVHDSIMRFAMSSWKEPNPKNARFPFGEGVKQVRANIFSRLSSGLMAFICTEEIPDVFIEQFAECKLNQNVVGLDNQTRVASYFYNGVDVADVTKTDGEILARVHFENVALSKIDRTKKKMSKLSFDLLYDGEVVSQGNVYPGIKRVVYLDGLPSRCTDSTKFSVRMNDDVEYTYKGVYVKYRK